MEKKQLIKSLKSVSKGNKKVFLLMDVEPSIEVTGGLTGTHNFDLEQIEKVQTRVEVYVRVKGPISHRDLLIFIKQMGVLPPDMVRDEDIEQVLTSMLLDFKLETVSSTSSELLYKAGNWDYGAANVAYTETPCSYCRLKGECGPTNEINPQTCEYMRDWLEMF